MISASIGTPVEIWTGILKYAIHVPIFFDVDPIGSSGVAAIQQYHWELPYWSSERHRNSFRRVCSSWNQYLSRFNHRYIRMTDIVHGVVPKTAFPHAIRLNIDLCKCKICTGFDRSSPQWNIARQVQSRGELLRDLVNMYGQRPQLKIFSGDGYNIALEISRLLHPIKLESIASSDIGFLAETDAANLRVVIGRSDGIYRPVNQHHPPLRFPSLTTLSVQVESFTDFTGLRFDTLKHLSILLVVDQSTEPEFLITMLKAFGSQLETFFWRNVPNNHAMPGEIWSICPRLRHIQTPYKWGPEPPLNHPIRCVRLLFPVTGYWNLAGLPSREDFREQLPVAADGRFKERGVMLAFHWPVLLYSFYGSASFWEAMDVAADSGLSLIDLSGQYLEEYILTFLVNVWRRVIVRRTYRDKQIEDEPLGF